jgi:hypothetical protein
MHVHLMHAVGTLFAHQLLYCRRVLPREASNIGRKCRRPLTLHASFPGMT